MCFDQWLRQPIRLAGFSSSRFWRCLLRPLSAKYSGQAMKIASMKNTSWRFGTAHGATARSYYRANLQHCEAAQRGSTWSSRWCRVSHLVMFIGISVVVLLQYDKPEAVTGLMAAFVAAMMVGIGWVVQHQTSARASRRAHTFNILMQSRLNKEFGENVAFRASYYHAGFVIPAEDAPLVTKKACGSVWRILRSGGLERLNSLERHLSLKSRRASLQRLSWLTRSISPWLERCTYLIFTSSCAQGFASGSWTRIFCTQRLPRLCPDSTPTPYI